MITFYQVWCSQKRAGWSWLGTNEIGRCSVMVSDVYLFRIYEIISTLPKSFYLGFSISLRKRLISIKCFQKFFVPAVDNIRLNLGGDSVSEDQVSFTVTPLQKLFNSSPYFVIQVIIITLIKQGLSFDWFLKAAKGL